MIKESKRSSRRVAYTPARLLAPLFDVRLLLCILLALASVLLAYQAPVAGSIPVGWLGDRLFLRADSGAARPESFALYADELTPGAPNDRSRWTRAQAELTLPRLGGEGLTIELAVQGWPAVPAELPVRQPTVTVFADNTPLGTFTPDDTWRVYGFGLPAYVRHSNDLRLHIEVSHTFTNSVGPDGTIITDPRPKGVRLATVTLRGQEEALGQLLEPDWSAARRLALFATLFYLALRRLLGSSPAFVATALLTGGFAGGLSLGRVWAAALLPQLVTLALVTLVLAHLDLLLQAWSLLLERYRRGAALGYGLLAAALVWLALIVAGWVLRGSLIDRERFWAEFPDSLLVLLLLIMLFPLMLLEGPPRFLRSLQQRLLHGRLALTLLLALGGTWIGYEALLLRDLPAIGHADYADNGVVARNLLEGRGFVVDYVTQYYRFYNNGMSVTRPQETWPLLQPLWIAPFFAAFGPSAWAARLPNLLFNSILLLLIFNIGTYLWDQRVGLCAALLTLTNHLLFNVTIYATSDLAFVVFATGAIYCLYRGSSVQAPMEWPSDLHLYLPRSTKRIAWQKIARVPGLLWIIGSSLLTGLMLLQRPSSGLIAAGMGVWLLAVCWHRYNLRRTLELGLLWGSIALVLLLPYLGRNLLVFGKPFYSTESHDAWVIEYSPDWDDIYNIYMPLPPLNGPGVPDRSWILRWGFDGTLRKVERQWIGLRNLMLPIWGGGPLELALKPERDSITLLHTMGGWLALAALPLALRRRVRLLSLLLLAFGPYLCFLITYWHIEERYLPMLIPWMALLAMGILWAAYDQLAALGNGRWAGIAIVMVGAALLAIISPSWPKIADKIRNEPALWAPDIDAYQFLRTLPPDTVVMARGPWQLNFYADRPAIMTPNTASVDQLLYIARYYRARFLVVETIQNTGTLGQAALRQLTLDREGGEECRPTEPDDVRPGRRLPIAYCSEFYQTADGSRYQTVVYRFPADYGGVAGGAP